MTDHSHAGHPVNQTASPNDSLDPYADLPRVVPLGGHIPARRDFDWRRWDPSRVAGPDDLPPYLVMGPLDRASFAVSARGWSARWQGRDAGSFVDVAFEPDPTGWTIREHWCRLDGRFVSFPADRPAFTGFLQALSAGFPGSWEAHLRERLEALWGISLVGREPGAPTICGLPDGALYTLLIPVSAARLRFVQRWLSDHFEAASPSYPVNAEARLVFQAINHVEGLAPRWTQDARVSFLRSVRDVGLPPDHLPVREQAEDGTAAWTSRRHLYCVFITVPFAGLLDLVERIKTEAPASWSALAGDAPFELRPVAIPAGLGHAGVRISLWDRGRTTRSLLIPGAPQRDIVPRVLAEPEDEAQAGLVALARIDALSARLLRISGADQVIRPGV